MIEGIADFYAPGISVYRKTTATNDIGDSIETWTLHLSIDGLIRPISGNEMIENDKNTSTEQFILYCAVQDITKVDEIEDINGLRYKILAVKNPMNFNNHFQITMEVKE